MDYLIGDFNFTEDEADHWGISQGKFKASGGISAGSKRGVRCFQQLFRGELRFEKVHQPSPTCKGTNNGF